jgi:glycosyltransferase involved in cell wall biosynthesis
MSSGIVKRQVHPPAVAGSGGRQLCDLGAEVVDSQGGRSAGQAEFFASDDHCPAEMRLAVITTHPIQYQCPVWRRLASRPEVVLKVFFASDCSVRGYHDAGFARQVQWSVPLLDGYEHAFLGSGPVSRWTTGPMLGARSLSRSLRVFRPDVCLLNAYSPLLYWHALGVCRLAGVPVLLRAEATDVDRHRGGLHRCIRDLSLRWFYSGVARCLAIGVNSRAHYVRLGVGPERIGFAPYCVDTDLFARQYSSRIPGKLRERLALSGDSVVVLFSGKLIPKKDPLTLLKAVASQPAIADRPVHLVFLGDGPLRLELEAQAAASAPGRVHFLGFQQQESLGDVYADADMLVLPSVYEETWGLVVNEALQFGVPCVVSDRVGCAPDLIAPGRTGEVFAHGDVGSLRDAIVRLAASKVERGPEVHEWCRSHVSGYSIDAAVNGILAAASAARRRAAC